MYKLAVEAFDVCRNCIDLQYNKVLSAFGISWMIFILIDIELEY